ncbi:MAG TPA: pitrilysin family protein [Thiobacillaceae bacterium]|nr:pitrilysin family protein [Thiobacillaceae bacterium]
MLLLGAAFFLTLAVRPGHAETRETDLANGMKVIVKVDHRAPVVTSQVWYRAGSMDESYGVTGVAHVLEHMMFKGTEAVPAGEFSKRIAAVGGKENAYTSRDQTVYFQTLRKEELELALRLEADRMANLKLDAGEFAKEIQVVREERRMRTEDNPQALLFEKLMATAFVSHPYRHPVIGWMGDLENMTVADAQHWYRTWYAPNNATLIVAGDVEPERVFDLARQYFGALPAQALPERKPQTEPAPSGLKQVELKAPAKLPVVVLSWQVPRLTRPAEEWEPYALEVLAGVLNGHATARLPQALVNEKRVAVDVGASYDAVSRGPGVFFADVTPAEGKTAEQALAALKGEIDWVKLAGVNGKELERVKAQVLAGQVFQQDSLFYQAMLIGEWRTAGLDYRQRDLRYEKLRQVTAEQVRAVANKYLMDDRLTIARLDPQPMSEAAAPRPALGGRHGG